jgi:threonine dehydratase
MTSSTVSTASAAAAVPPDSPAPAIVFADVEAAARRLAGKAVVTPLLPVPALEAELGARVFVKPEVLQRTGSFKFRGAYNKLAQLSAEERKRGVVAFSSGNHAQGVAAAAQLFDAPAVIVMPSDAPDIKVANTRGYGAEVVLYDRDREDREAIARGFTQSRGMTLVPPFDDPAIIAGQGTVGLEIARQAETAGAKLDLALTCCGGGGLTAGTALALKTLSPATQIHAVEPAGFDDTGRSLRAGERLANVPGPKSFCDALLSPMPGALTFPLNRSLLAGALAVTDAEVAAAMAFAFRTLKLVVEPGGAVALAALLSGKLPVQGKTVVVILSGGNVDWSTYQQALSSAGA